jgi:hypothetical protein
VGIIRAEREIGDRWREGEGGTCETLPERQRAQGGWKVVNWAVEMVSKREGEEGRRERVYEVIESSTE